MCSSDPLPSNGHDADHIENNFLLLRARISGVTWKWVYMSQCVNASFDRIMVGVIAPIEWLLFT
jgi:hypothetical protein